ncbi:MAG: nuclear transport factor 2 family protein [Pseudomonadota bacterium]
MTDLIHSYFRAFNAKDIEAMIGCLSPSVIHHPNGGGVRHGQAAFRDFCVQLFQCYDEHLVDIVLFVAKANAVTAQYKVKGSYLQTEDGFPDAKGQTYTIPCRSFFMVQEGLITQVGTVYDLDDWIAQVS